MDSPEEVVERCGGLLAAHQVVEGGVAHHALHDGGGVPPPAQEVVHLPAPPHPKEEFNGENKNSFLRFTTIDRCQACEYITGHFIWPIT